jgi:hypothetical protein
MARWILPNLNLRSILGGHESAALLRTGGTCALRNAVQ